MKQMWWCWWWWSDECTESQCNTLFLTSFLSLSKKWCYCRWDEDEDVSWHGWVFPQLTNNLWTSLYKNIHNSRRNISEHGNIIMYVLDIFFLDFFACKDRVTTILRSGCDPILAVKPGHGLETIYILKYIYSNIYMWIVIPSYTGPAGIPYARVASLWISFNLFFFFFHFFFKSFFLLFNFLYFFYTYLPAATLPPRARWEDGPN